MVTAMHLCGVKTPHPAFTRRAFHCRPLWAHQLLDSLVSLTSCSGPVVKNSFRRSLRVSCERGNVDVLEQRETKSQGCDEVASELTCVMKFGGSSVASAERMREVADLILSFREERPVIVLSAMGKTTNKLLLVFVTSIFCCVFVKLYIYIHIPTHTHSHTHIRDTPFNKF